MFILIIKYFYEENKISKVSKKKVKAFVGEFKIL